MKQKFLAYRYPIGVFLIMRVLLSLLGILGLGFVPGSQGAPAAEGYNLDTFTHLQTLWYGVWERSDSLWFYHIARDGYIPGSPDAVFFPLYPLLIRALNALSLFGIHLSALILSNFFLLLALIFIFKLVKFEFDEETAKRALWYQVLYPGGIFLFIGYSESTFLAFLILTFYFARKGEWKEAAITAGCLSLTRHIGILVGVPLGVEFLLQRLKPGYYKASVENPIPTDPKARWLPALYFLVTLCFFSGYLLFQNGLSGDPFIWVKLHSHWSRESNPPWNTFFYGVKQGFDYLGAFPGGMFTLEAWVALMGLGLGIASFWFLPLSYSALWIVFFIPALTTPYRNRMFMSFVRILVVCFPIFLTLARLAKEELVDYGVKITFATLFGICVVLLINNLQFF